MYVSPIDINHAKKEKKFILGISLDLQAEYDSVYIDRNC